MCSESLCWADEQEGGRRGAGLNKCLILIEGLDGRGPQSRITGQWELEGRGDYNPRNQEAERK